MARQQHSSACPAVRILDASLLGACVAGLLALAESLASGSLRELVRDRSPSELRALGSLLWLHLGYGALVGSCCGVLFELLERIGARLWSALRAGFLTGAVLSLAVREHLAPLRPAAESALQNLLFTAAVVAAMVLLASVLFALLGRLPHRETFPRLLLRAGTATFALVAATCSFAFRAGSGGPPDTARPNVVLISLDTVRADHLEVYGYPRPTSPNLREFARDAVIFESVFAPEPWTLPSHMSMMTSLYPVTHGVRSRSASLNPKHTTLAEALHAAGYTGTAFVAGGPESWIGGLRGFSQGFHGYHHPPHFQRRTLGASLPRILYRHLGPAAGSAEDVNQAALEFLDPDPAQPFFLFLHYFDAHSDYRQLPYDAPPALVELFAPEGSPTFSGCDESRHCASKFLLQFSGCEKPAIERAIVDSIVAHYDAGIRGLDVQLGKLFGSLRSLGLYDSSLILVTSDHGEEFLEHGRFLHNQLHRETLHVPLLIKWPSRKHAGKRVAVAASNVDLMPTLLDALEIAHEGEMQGRSLLPYVEGAEPRPSDLFFSNTEQGGGFRTLQLGVQSGEQKLLRRLIEKCPGERGDEVYDLGTDPEEKTKLAPDVAGADGLASRLARWYDASRLLHQERPAPDSVELGEDEIERLRALGYLVD